MISRTVAKLIIFFITTTVVINAQVSQNYTAPTKLKAGIYKSFEEFKNNAPSIELSFDILEQQLETGGYVQHQETSFYSLNIEKEAAKKVGKVYGFSDGTHVYINEYHQKLKSNTLFMKVVNIGAYYVFEYEDYHNNTTVMSKRFQVIDMNSGKIKLISRARFMKAAQLYNASYVSQDNLKNFNALVKS